MWNGHTEEAAFCASPKQLGLSAVELDAQHDLPAPLHQYHQRVREGEEKGQDRRRRQEEEETGKQFQWVPIRDVMWTLQPETLLLLLPSSSLPPDVVTGGVASWESYQHKMGEDGNR